MQGLQYTVLVVFGMFFGFTILSDFGDSASVIFITT